MTFHIYLIRHGQSANNALPEPQRVEDPGLTKVGELQAAALAARLQDEKVTHLLTSGFLRAVATTQPLAKTLNVAPVIWTGLHEVGGCYAGHEPDKEVGRPGMNRKTLSNLFPEFKLPNDLDDQGWWKSQPYEDWTRAKHRAQAQVERLVNEFAGTNANVALVIHADFKALMLESLLPTSHEQFVPAGLLNTGVTLLRHDGEQFEMLSFNNPDHLGGLKTS